jgi:hypothetical protein
MKRIVRPFHTIAPIGQLVWTACDRSGQKAEMWLYGFMFGLLQPQGNATSIRSRSGAFRQNGSSATDWRLPLRGLSYRFFGRPR